jgi:transcription initiation factor TFIIIB Brf1 subunit/transcription initiation factor TFIIB
MHKEIAIICNDLDIPKHVHRDTLYRFRKLRAAEAVEHHQTYYALAYCLWTSIKYYELTVNLRDLISAFKNRGHTCTTKYVFMNKTKFDRVFKKYDIKINELRRVMDYVHPLIQELRPAISIKSYITFETELKFEVLSRLKQGSYIRKIAENTEYSEYMVRKEVVELISENYIEKKPRTNRFVLYKLKPKAKAFLKDYSKKRSLEYEFKDYYLTELEKLALIIAEKLERPIKMNGRTPYNKCCALIYFADKLLALKNEHFPLLTQGTIAKLTDNDTVNIRLAWLELFRDFYKNEKKRIEKERGLLEK